MLNKVTLAFVAIAICATSAFAGSGIFGSGVELNINGTLTLYALNNGGGARLTPTGSTAVLDSTSWNNGTEASPVLNLGSFDPAAGNTLTLTGGSLLTFKNGLSNVTGAFLDYRIFQGSPPTGSFTEFSLPFNQDNVNGNGGDQRWATETQSINLLSGLAPGTYTLGVFLRETSSDSGAFSSNNGANYGATFTVVPEPSSLALLGGPAILGAWFYIRRRRA